MANLSDVDERRDRQQVAAYVADLTCELALVARRNGLDALSYLLDMARMEAESAAHRPKSPDAKRNKTQG